MSVPRRMTTTVAPSAATAVATNTAVVHELDSTAAPAAAAPSETPATSAVSGQVNASVAVGLGGAAVVAGGRHALAPPLAAHG